MITLETILAILAAVITMLIAGFLVKKQNEYEEKTKELRENSKDGLADIASEVLVLTTKESSECTLLYLERRMDTFNKTLNIVQKPTYKRRNKSVKRPKNLTDD